MTPPTPSPRLCRHLGPAVGLLLVLAWLGACTAGTPPPEPPSTEGAASPAPEAVPAISRLEWIGEAHLPYGYRYQETQLGGLSGLAFDPGSGAYYAVSDDRSQQAPARVYRLAIDLADGRLDAGDLEVTGLVTLHKADGETYPEGTIDAEGVVLLDALVNGEPGRELLISTEGDTRRGLPPFIARYGLDGRFLGELPVPDRFHPAAESDAPRGVRNNQGFESLTLSPDGSRLFAATEAALAQDGPAPGLDNESPSRILIYRPTAEGWELTREVLYPVEPVAAPAVPQGSLQVRGLVEMLALDADTLLALERSYSNGAGYSIELFRVDLRAADDLRRFEALPAGALEAGSPRPVVKERLLDLGDLGVPLDNLEGMALGPALLDGRRTLLIISDDNFLPLQSTQLLAFALDREPAGISDLQGRGHRSPWENQWVFDLEGVVTAALAPDPLDEAQRNRAGVWIQEPQLRRTPGASQGLFVATGALAAGAPGRLPELGPGDALRLHGRVREAGRAGDLPVTRLEASWIAVEERDQPLPEPVVLGTAKGDEERWVRTPPLRNIDDDGLSDYQPEEDAADFYESLEGMRLEVRRPRVVGATSRFGEIALLADGGAAPTAARTSRAGVLITEDDPHPERLLLEPRLGPPNPAADVGDLFEGTVIGVLDSSFSNYKLLPTEPLPPLLPHGGERPVATLVRGDSRLTVATYNVENFSLTSPKGKLDALAHTLVFNLGAPDLVALQEVQDDSGPADDGVIFAGRTLDALVARVEALGGPRYTWCQIDPEPGTEGGRPGGNIRVALLFDASRLALETRGAAGPRDSTHPEPSDRGPRLTLNPGRVAADDPSFVASRRPLAAELEFGDQRLFVVVNHFNSKGGDDGLFGDRQPPVPHTEVQRLGQTVAVADFVAEILTLDPEAKVVVLGDFNELPWRPPLHRLLEAPLVSLMDRVPAEERYSYNFQGNSQLLDYVLVSPALARNADPQIEILHINADFAARPSDHDPVLVSLTFPEPGPGSDPSSGGH